MTRSLKVVFMALCLIGILFVATIGTSPTAYAATQSSASSGSAIPASPACYYPYVVDARYIYQGGEIWGYTQLWYSTDCMRNWAVTGCLVPQGCDWITAKVDWMLNYERNVAFNVPYGGTVTTPRAYTYDSHGTSWATKACGIIASSPYTPENCTPAYV